MIERYEDVKKRFEFVNAERNMYAKGTKEYEALSEIIKLILGEYGKKYANNRYSFRFYNGNYHLVVLSDNEEF